MTTPPETGSQMTSDAVGLKDVKIPLQRLAPLTTFRTRGGDTLGYRLYPAWSENLLMLVHGVGGDSRYLAIAAHKIASSGIATVVTPDLRGHGTEPHGPRAGVAKDSQLEQDLEETLIHVRMSRGFQRMVWGGHSLGAALASRVALNAGSAMQTGLLLIAPMMPAKVQAQLQNDFGGWIAHRDGIIHVNMPGFFRTGTEVLEYEESFFRAAMVPEDLAAQLTKANIKTRVVLGDQDQVFPADAAQKYFDQIPSAKVSRTPTHHLGIVAMPGALSAITDALTDLFA